MSSLLARTQSPDAQGRRPVADNGPSSEHARLSMSPPVPIGTYSGAPDVVANAGQFGAGYTHSYAQSTTLKHDIDRKRPTKASIAHATIAATNLGIVTSPKLAKIANAGLMTNASNGLLDYEASQLPPSILKQRALALALGTPSRPQKAPKAHAPPEREPQETPGMSKVELQALVDRQNAMLVWYASRYPGVVPGPTSELHEIENQHRDSKETLIEALERRFLETENLIGRMTAKQKELLGALRSQKESYDAHLAREAEARAQAEGAITKQFQAKLTSMQDSHRQQTHAISKLKTQVQLLEDRLEDAAQGLEKSIDSNKMLMGQTSDIERKWIEADRSLAACLTERDRAQQWVRDHQGSVEDYQSCMREAGLTATLQNSTFGSISTGSFLLTRYFKNLRGDLEDARRRVIQLEQELAEARKKFAVAEQQHALDQERTQAELRVARNHLQDATTSVERMRAERDQSFSQLQRAIKEVAHTNEQLLRMQREKDEELAEVASRTAAQLRLVREEYDSERRGIQHQVESLQRGKVELQVQVGQMMRDRRGYAANGFGVGLRSLAAMEAAAATSATYSPKV